jgi:prepilin-type N-terminal cleavage/methylation domain-containing protein
MKSSKQSGFTLIELLVVIAIIGILASVILASLDSARSKANDAKIKGDLEAVQTALALYYDQYHTYFIPGSGFQGTGQGWFADQDGLSYALGISNALTQQGFMPAMPNQSPANYMMFLCDNNQQYSLVATLADPTPDDIAHVQTLCNGTGSNGAYNVWGKNYGVGN